MRWDGQTRAHFKCGFFTAAIMKKRKNAGVFPKKGDSGLDFGKAVAYSCCLFLDGYPERSNIHWQKN